MGGCSREAAPTFPAGFCPQLQFVICFFGALFDEFST